MSVQRQFNQYETGIEAICYRIFSNEAREQKNGFILEYTIFITMFKKLFVSTISTVTVVLFKERKKLYSLGGVYSRLYSKRREGGQTE